MSSIPSSSLIALLRQDVTAEALAAEHGLSVAEVKRLERAYLDGLDAGSRRRGSTLRRLATVGIVFAVGLTARQALSGTCATPGSFSGLGLNFFCADDPALASEVNANTQQLARLVEAKVGALGPASTGNGNVAASSVSATRGSVSFFTPPYAVWTGNTGDIGAGGATILNDNDAFRALMVVGNTSAGGARRQVKVFDDLTVIGRLNVQEKQCHTIANTCQATGTLEFLDRQSMMCPTDEVLQGLSATNCGGTVRIAITCCKY
ncbi:MAG: hypothetical protein ABTQ32_39295 [Myxococcaceae bacterium]